MTEAWEKAVEAMRTRRKELIAQPIDRIYGELLAAAFPILAEDLVTSLTSRADLLETEMLGGSDDFICAYELREQAEALRARIDQMKERG